MIGQKDQEEQGEEEESIEIMDNLKVLKDCTNGIRMDSEQEQEHQEQEHQEEEEQQITIGTNISWIITANS